jgi:hypothetical protein
LGDEEIELIEFEDEDELVLNLSGSRSKLLSPPLLGVNLGFSVSSSSNLSRLGENRDETEPVSKSSSNGSSSAGLLRLGRLILDLS